MKQLNLFLLCVLFIVVSCKEEVPEPEIIDFTKVSIRWSGYYRIDGCGFFIEIDGVSHKSINEDFLGAEFQASKDTIVEMQYLDLNREITAHCGEGFPFKIKGIEILDIQ